MSTNYYMHTTDKEFVKKHFCQNNKEEYSIVDEPYLSYEIHIGKRSHGWKPLFATHRDAYNSVQELIDFIKNNNDKIRIFDEYSIELSLDELKEELIDWGNIDYEDDKKYSVFEMRFKEDENGTLQKPFDHIDCMKQDPLQSSFLEDSYWKDEEGYNFLEGSFC